MNVDNAESGQWDVPFKICAAEVVEPHTKSQGGTLFVFVLAPPPSTETNSLATPLVLDKLNRNWMCFRPLGRGPEYRRVVLHLLAEHGISHGYNESLDPHVKSLLPSLAGEVIGLGAECFNDPECQEIIEAFFGRRYGYAMPSDVTCD